MTNYKFLDKINYPSDLKKLNKHELKELAVELRKELIEAVSETKNIAQPRMNATYGPYASFKKT